MEQLGSHSSDFSWNLIFEDFFFFRKICREDSSFSKIFIHMKTDIPTFFISHSLLPRMKNVPVRSCRGKHTFWFPYFFFPKIMLFMRKCGKILKSATGHRWRYNTTQAHCMLDDQGHRHTQSGYEILTDFPGQRWLRERAVMLTLYLHCHSCFFLSIFDLFDPTNCSCRGLLLHLITLSDTHSR